MRKRISVEGAKEGSVNFEQSQSDVMQNRKQTRVTFDTQVSQLSKKSVLFITVHPDHPALTNKCADIFCPSNRNSLSSLSGPDSSGSEKDYK